MTHEYPDEHVMGHINSQCNAWSISNEIDRKEETKHETYMLV